MLPRAVPVRPPGGPAAAANAGGADTHVVLSGDLPRIPTVARLPAPQNGRLAQR